MGRSSLLHVVAMRLLCSYYGAAMLLLYNCYAVAMRLLCGGYAVAIQLLCGCYAVAMRLLCGFYAVTMQLLSSCYAVAMLFRLVAVKLTKIEFAQDLNTVVVYQN